MTYMQIVFQFLNAQTYYTLENETGVDVLPGIQDELAYINTLPTNGVVLVQHAE